MQTPSANTDLTQDPKRDKLVAPKKKRNVKLEILRDTHVKMLDGSTVLKIKGDVVEVDEDEARALLNFKVKGSYGFTGERTGEQKIQTLRKARVYVEAAPQDEFAPDSLTAEDL